jgi:hypothetical protein
MKRYWDHTEEERAALTAPQVEALLGYELMEKGVLVIGNPPAEAPAEVPIPTRRVYCLVEKNGGVVNDLDLCFNDETKARAALGFITWIREAPWNAPAHTRAPRDLMVMAVEMPNEADVAASRAALADRERRKREHDEAKRGYDEAQKKVAESTADVWSDWRRCIAEENHRERIRATMAEYLKMTDGNDGLARSFLAKVFTPEDIRSALGDPEPMAETPPPQPSPGTEAAVPCVPPPPADEIPW